MKTILRLFILFMFLPCAVLAKEKVNESSLSQVFDKLRHTQGCVCENVKYSGNNWQKAGGGFIWQRGTGSGWTKGERLILDGVKPSEVQRIRKVFESFESLQHVNLSYENMASTYMNDTRTIYLYEYDKNAGRLYFLKATTDGEISVPMVWKEVSVLDATGPVTPSTNPFAGFHDSELRLLGLSRLWAGVKQNFVFMDRFQKNWDSIYVAAMSQVQVAQDDEECTRIFQRMAAELGDGHTYVWGVSHHTERIPLRTKYIDGHVYIDEVLSEHLQKSGIRRGMELLSINGESVLEYGEKHVRPYISSSTLQWTQHLVYENDGLFVCQKGDTLNLELKKGNHTFMVRTWPQSSFGGQKPSLELTILKNKTGYLRIRDFMVQNFQKVFDKLYPDILKTEALVIDVRDNGGGNSGNADYILRHFSHDSIRTDSWRTPMYMPAFASWGYPLKWYISPSGKMAPFNDRTIYDKPIVLLVNAGTFSAAEDFCSVFRGMKRGLIVGTPTGGSTGNGVRIELIPGKNYVNICSKHDKGADGTEFVGIGIIPDHEVAETYKSFFKDKYDAAITASLKILAEDQNDSSK